MTIEVRQLGNAEVAELLSLKEGHFADGKRIAITPAKLSKAISALANADGGDLFVGLAEKPDHSFDWEGFARQEDANAHLQVFEALFPLGTGFTYEFLASGQSGVVLHVGIAKATRVLKASDGVPYVRRGAQNIPVNTPDSLRVLERNKGITSFETEPVNADLSQVTGSETVLGFVEHVVPRSDPEKWLRKQQLIIADKPTVAGVVLFADMPQALLPKRCGIKIYRYKTSKAAGNRETLVGQPATIEGCAYDCIHMAVSEAQSAINDLQVLGPDGLAPVSYPPETLHEVITNAVLHRDYAIADDVHIRIFDNRVEVESPGRLPGHVTVKNILDERFARNGNLVRVINKFPNPPNKDVGEGLNTAFDAMRQLRLKDPVIKEEDASVLVIIRHEKLASAEEIVLEYMKSNDSITNAIGRSLTGIDSENAMKSVFYRLRDRKLLEQDPNLAGNKSAWRLTKRGRSEVRGK